MRCGVVRFPGSNCDQDCYWVLREVFGVEARYVWHGEATLDGYDLVVLPGGFSYGDYLRCGAIARYSPVMAAVARAAERGVLVMGICNGFQILCEAGLLPGALVRNRDLHFICEYRHLRVENAGTPFTSAARVGEVLRMPIAHGEGNFRADGELLRRLEGDGRVVLRYCDAAGGVGEEANPNGSAGNIAGVCNGGGNVFGLMPHPERACDALTGGTDGRRIFESALSAAARRAGAVGS